MKRFVRSLTIPVLLLLAPLATGLSFSPNVSEPVASRDDSGGCSPVDCGWYDTCRACVGGGDAIACHTSGCYSCTVDGYCKPNPDSRRDPILQSGLRLDRRTIREIAVVHPRFAATLALQNAIAAKLPARTRWTPVELTAEDIGAFLHDGGDSQAILQRLDKKARKLNKRIIKGELTEVVHNVSVSRESPTLVVVKLEVTKSSPVDPPYSSLTIRLHYSEDTSLAKSQKPINTEWEIK